MCLLKNTAWPEKVGMYSVTHESVTVAHGQR